MNKTRASLLSLSLLLVCAAGSVLRADDCNQDCNVSTNCSSNTCSDNDCNFDCSTGNNDCGDNNDCNSGCNTGCSTLLVTRDSHSNTAYRYLPFAHRDDECEFNGGFALGYEFQQTFKDQDLARCLFGTSTLSFKGSQVAGRNSETDILADYFGLSQLFQGTLSFCPQVRNHNLHFESYWGFDNWANGLYLRADFTFTHQERRLFSDGCNSCCATSTVITNTTPFPPGYMGVGAVNAAPDILTALSGTFLFGDMQTPWAFGKFGSCKTSDNKVAGFNLDVGYDFWRCDDSYFGIFLRYEAPTGTKLNGRQKFADQVFYPVIGNMHHNGLGGGISARKELWSNDCGDSIEVYLDGYATHLFDDCQVRSFNLKDNSGTSLGCLSRYMLLKQLTPTTSTDTTTLSSAYPNATNGFAYTGTDINAINFATRTVKSSIGVTGDATLRFNYNHKGFTLGLGYNVFGRQREKLCLRPNAPVPCNAYNTNYSYGLKGCTGDYLFSYPTNNTATTTNSATATPVRSNATNSTANITSCSVTADNPREYINLGLATPTDGFVGVDWENIYSSTQTTKTFANAVPSGTATNLLVIAEVSATAVALTDANLDIESGRVQKLVSQKGYITLEYEWCECDWAPYLGLGGEVEGGTRCCDFKQWGVWLKGGFSF